MHVECMWRGYLLVGQWLLSWEPPIQISLPPSVSTQHQNIKQLLQPIRLVPPRPGEAPIQCNKDWLHTELWAVLLVSCQPLFFKGQLILWPDLSMAIRL